MNLLKNMTERCMPILQDRRKASDHEQVSVAPVRGALLSNGEVRAPDELLDLAVAVTLLQPHLGGLNAQHWLGDMRRREPSYAKRVNTPPRWLKHHGKVMYPVSEIKRIIRELNRFDNDVSLVA